MAVLHESGSAPQDVPQGVPLDVAVLGATGTVGQRFLSLLDASEHHQADPRATYLASYRLAEDSSWERVDGGTEEPWIEGA